MSGSAPEHRPPLLILPYDESWAARGVALTIEVGERIGAIAVRVDHIGSTAIPGMAAKPVFDLQVSVADLNAAAPVIDAAVRSMDLVRRPWERDHVPAFSHDAPELWAKRLWGSAGSGGERINLHCRLVGSPNERFALLFRDWFRAHPEDVSAYSRFKQVLAAAVDDREIYTDVKDPVVDLVVAEAERWATEADWSVTG